MSSSDKEQEAKMGGQQQEQTPAHYNTPPPPYAGPSQYGSSSSSYPRMPAQAYPTALPQAPPAYNPMAPPMYPGASNQQPYYVPSPWGGVPPSKAYPAANGAYPAWPMQNPSALPPNVTVVMPEAFDAQARFDCVARPNIPPPPPGVAPNVAQMAVMNGQSNQVVLGQKKPSFW